MKVINILVLLICGAVGCIGESESIQPRILSLSAAATNILIRLGFPPAAIDEYGKIAAGKTIPPVIGKGSAVSREKIVELNIDTAVLWYYQIALAGELKQKGIRVETVAPPRLATYPDLIRQLGELTGKKAKAEQLCKEFSAALNKSASPGGKKLRVYFELYADGKCVGKESYIGDLLKVAGGESIVRKTGLVSQETIISKSPEVIFYIKDFGNTEAILRRPGIANTPAARNRRIYPVSRRLIIEGIAPLKAIEYLKTCMR